MQKAVCVCFLSFFRPLTLVFLLLFSPLASAPAAHLHFVRTTSCFGDRKYQRSWEGSACVFISGIIFVSLFWYTFESALQFWIALAILPPAMAYAEATSPHTIDTPFLMGVGGTMLWVISHIDISWS